MGKIILYKIIRGLCKAFIKDCKKSYRQIKKALEKRKIKKIKEAQKQLKEVHKKAVKSGAVIELSKYAKKRKIS